MACMFVLMNERTVTPLRCVTYYKQEQSTFYPIP